VAFGTPTNRGTTQSKTANQASFVLNTSSAIPLGELAIIIIAVDNNSAVNEDEGAVTSVTDPQGNTWAKALEWCAPGGGAQLGATVSVWYSTITTEIPSATLITVNLSNSASRDASAATVRSCTRDTGKTIAIEQTASVTTVSGTDPEPISLSGMPSQEYLLVHGMAAEGPNTDAYTWDADYTQFSANGTTGGGAATNMHVRGGHRVATLTGDTVDVTSTTADRDCSQVLIAFEEVAAAPTNPPIPPVNAGFATARAASY